MGFGSFGEPRSGDPKEFISETSGILDVKQVSRVHRQGGCLREAQAGNPARWTRRVHRAGVTAYLLYNGSATYVMLRA